MSSPSRGEQLLATWTAPVTAYRLNGSVVTESLGVDSWQILNPGGNSFLEHGVLSVQHVFSATQHSLVAMFFMHEETET